MTELKYKRNLELRRDIAFAAGADPSRYGEGGNPAKGLCKADLIRVAEQLRPADDDRILGTMTIAELLPLVCDLAGGEYGGNAGSQWGLRRDNLKQIHRALDASDVREGGV